jgi:hypothetical protein
MGPEILAPFRRTAVVDIDPGLTQLWWADGDLELEGYDAYFTVGENVALGRAPVPDGGVQWNYVPPCVDLDAWPACPPASDGAAWTTVTNWWPNGAELDGTDVDNSKRAAFEPLFGVPARVPAPLELAIGAIGDDEELELLGRNGWRVRDAEQIVATAELQRAYVQGSRGEFSAARGLYVEGRVGWLSDRTVCYLASGRPAVIQDTGAPSLLGHEGLMTFVDADSAVAALTAAESDYEHHCRAARALAEEQFAGPVVAARVLEVALA